ncbi:DUF3592 domain-containing protein [Streptomyces sp. NPDC048527]|uniref:DUF3592 domain-containing protein n=1 Tax=Streptomyces sp. NPDC048527 TaxID=3365568 RepID=UPI00371DB6B4
MKRLLLIVMLLLGPLLWVFAWREVRARRRLRYEGIRAVGIVVRHERKVSGTEGTAHVYFPVVAFTDADGAPRECRSAYSGRRGWPVGRKVPVLYLPGTPATAVIDIWAQRVSRVAVLVAAGMVLIAVPLIFLPG